MEAVQNISNSIKSSINDLCEGQPPWKLIGGSVVSTVALFWLKDVLFQNESLSSRSKKKLFKFIRALPFVKGQIQNELKKISNGMLKEMNENINHDPYILQLPMKGWSKEKIIAEVNHYNKYGAFKWKEGYASGAVYNGSKELTDLVAEVYGMSVWTNPLHADVFPGIRKMEAEVVRMCCVMFNGGPESCGTMTTGGTESIVMACKAYRNYSQKVKGIKNPEMIIPVTAHAAFDKAAEMLNVSIKHAPVDPKTMKVNVKALEKMISKRTFMIVGSAPQFPNGVIDPIEELAALAKKYDIPLHVDACLGGFLIAFAEEAGYPLPKFDFRIQQVTSISCDTHKYGYTPKGSSVILYREGKYRHHQYFVAPDWPGAIYATPSMCGSRPGGIIAATWAAMIYFGKSGYIDCTRKIISTAKKITVACDSINGIRVVGQPEVSVVSLASDSFNIYCVSDAMTKKGWNLNPLQYPSAIHIAITVLHTHEGVAERFINDIREIVENLLKNPVQELGEMAAIYGMAQSIPDRSVVDEVAYSYIDTYYSTRTGTISNGI